MRGEASNVHVDGLQEHFSWKRSNFSPESATVLERLWNVAMETLWWLLGTMACCISFLNRATLSKVSFLVDFSVLLFAFKCVVKTAN